MPGNCCWVHLDVADAVVCRVHVEMRVAERVDMRLQPAHLPGDGGGGCEGKGSGL